MINLFSLHLLSNCDRKSSLFPSKSFVCLTFLFLSLLPVLVFADNPFGNNNFMIIEHRGGGNGTGWSIVGALYLYNNSGILDVNESRLNFTIISLLPGVVNGTPGTNGTNGLNGSNGINGTNGIDGTAGTNGTNATTDINQTWANNTYYLLSNPLNFYNYTNITALNYGTGSSNLTLAQVVASIGNWTLDKPNYVNQTYGNDTYVPYVGATKNVVLGANNLSVGGLGYGLFVDSSNFRVGVGLAIPMAKFHVRVDDILGLPTIFDSDMLLQDTSTITDTAVFSLIGGNGTGASSIYFGDSQDENAGALIYQHGGDNFSFTVNGTADKMVLSGDGNLSITNYFKGNLNASYVKEPYWYNASNPSNFINTSNLTDYSDRVLNTTYIANPYAWLNTTNASLLYYNISNPSNFINTSNLTGYINQSYANATYIRNGSIVVLSTANITQINLGDASSNLYLQTSANPTWGWDSNDYMQFTRSTNILKFVVGGGVNFVYSATNITIGLPTYSTKNIDTLLNFSVNGTQGVTGSGTSCVISSIKGGIITGAVCT